MSEERRGELDLEFPPKPEFVGTARHAVAALARLHDVPDSIVEDVKLAVSEACTNSVTVTRRAGRDEPVRLVASIDADALFLDVMDRGEGPVQLEDQVSSEVDSQEFSFERGLSLPLVRGLVDDLRVDARDGGGSVVRMRLSLAQ